MKKNHVIPMAVLSSALFIGTVAPTPSYAISQEASPKAHEQIQQNVHKDKDPRPFFVQEKQKVKYTKANENSAKAHLKKNKAKFKVHAPDQSLGNAEVTKDDLGMTHVKLQQEKNGVPVEGHQVIVHYDKENQVQSVNGHFNEAVEKENFSTKASVSKTESLAVAKQSVEAPDDLVEPPSSNLVIYPFNDKNHLAYKVNVNFLGENPGNWFVYVDAHTGEVIDQYNALMHADGDGYKASKGAGTGVLGENRNLHISHKNEKGSGSKGTNFFLYDKSHENIDGIYTYDAKNSWDYADLQNHLFSSRDASFKDEYERPAVDAHYNSEKVYEYYLEEHDRNSIDGEGMAIKSTVHFGEDYANAFWNGEQMTYGDGDGEFFIPLSAGLDVAAHEMAHGVTTHSAGLKYRFQSGALNEAFSDIFGALVDEEDWEIGEDIMAEDAITSGRTSLRSLSNPSKYPVGEDYVPYGDGSGMYPSHMDEYYDLPLQLDNGGVHINSSIINHAAYITGEQIGKEKLGQIYYRALTVYLHPESDFSHARESLIQSAIDLYGEGSEEVLATEDGFNQVGITE
ncbi:bacillolysin/thermolysin/neutral peptidase B [Halobacillus karajensis]|uniref:Neutral metalloproteinase n=1 Tax=Halobacillus karajensis TaxID=195088 RepID=A0A024P2R4_9BACI|nr:M4 family metallopeptidase [Halobacillus karajensis]CDQ19143.1 Stearolysin precursor [Halobacillus karajensis]CDQ22783.1 Stearolysin precursor [Halobacillus karajensis]CDQ26265.1 Stearolysin precursor [Halobacillus karajensis]SEH40954.1 bacillolysin/thermolysin/neutral peptidase B [Halobacillus karajensis]